MYYINSFGLSALTKKKENAVKILLIAIPLFFFLALVLYNSMSQVKIAFFLAVLPFITIYNVFIFFVSRTGLIRCNKTIIEIEIANGIISFLTLQTLFFDEKRIETTAETIRISKGNYPWYIPKKTITGFTLIINNESYYLVDDFFDACEEMHNKLLEDNK